MKTRHIVLLVLLLIITLIGLGVQTFLARGLASVLNQRVFPEIQARYGLVLSVEDASVSLLKRRAEFWGFAIRNLEGFGEPALLTVDKCKIDLELLSLLKRNPIVFKLVKAKGVTLVAERNGKGALNLQELADALDPKPAPQEEPAAPYTGAPLRVVAESAPQEEPTAPAPAAAASGDMPVHIRRLVLDGFVRYVDTERNLRIPLSLRLLASDLFSIPAEDQPFSLIVLRGAHADNPDTFVTDLNAIVEPLVDPENPSFDLSGGIEKISTDLLTDLLVQYDMESDSFFSIKPSVTCKQGSLEGSHVNLVLDDLTYRGAALGEIALKFPFTGTLQNPEYDLTLAIQSIFSKQTIKLLSTIGLQELDKATGDPEEKPESQEAGETAPPEPPQPKESKTPGDLLFEQLEKSMKEVEGNKDIKDALNKLGSSLFGD